MPSKLEEFRKKLAAAGVAATAPVSETLGRIPGSPTPRISSFPSADVDVRPEAEFVLREEIGRGGMATVWVAAQRALGRDVAVKRASDPDDKDAEQLLLREALLAGQLEHPNIVPIHQLVIDARGPAVVMKRISGETWDALLQRQNTSLERHLEIFLQALNAVGFAHSRGVLHRDIKPTNVMIGSYGEVYLLDWGVAKRAQDPPSSAIVGTPHYMAPEMAEGQADERTDVFLLGATLHEVLTGEPRHKGSDALAVLYAAMYVEPYVYPASVPRELAEICNRACARDPAQRYVSVLALREAVQVYREHRAANTLTENALTLLARLEECVDRPERDAQSYSEPQRLFTETRLGFESALRIWPESPAALSGLAESLYLMIDYEIAVRRPEAAQALLELSREPDPEQAARIVQLRAQLAEERAHIARIERDQDPSVGARGRTRAYLGMGAATALMTLSLLIQRLVFPGFKPSTFRLTIVGAVVLVIMLTVAALWRRYGTFNLINRRIAEISVSTLAVSFASRLSGYMTGTEPERVLICDAFILGLGGLVLSTYHRAGPWLSVMSFAVALLGTIWPDSVDELFIVLSVFVPTAMLALKRAELAPSDQLASGPAVTRDPKAALPAWQAGPGEHS